MTRKTIILFVALVLVSAIGLISLVVRTIKHKDTTQQISAKARQGITAQAAKHTEVQKKVVVGVGKRELTDEEYAQYYASLTPKEQREYDEIEKLFTTMEGAQKMLAEMKKLLSGPDPGNWGVQFQAQIAMEAICRYQGNAILPYVEEFLEDKNIWQREFARDSLFELGTQEALSLVRKQFWEFYGKAKNWDKIEAGSAASSYHGAELDVEARGAKEYWEARHIFESMVKHSTSGTDGIASRLLGADNGLGVLAAQYLWRTAGEKYRDDFYKYSNAKVDSETFYTFVKELRDIFWDGQDKEYEGMKKLQDDFDKRAIALTENTKLDEWILWNLIEYLSQAEPDWFAENWVRLYQYYQKNTPSAWGLDSAIRRGVVRNEKAKKNIQMLSSITDEDDYNYFIRYVREQEEMDKMKSKRESKQK